MKRLSGSRIGQSVDRLSVFLITAALIAGMAGCGGTPSGTEIRDWYDLDAIRDNLGGSYILMNDLDSTTAGYEELASSAANGGKGWEPIGTEVYPSIDDPFTGTFDGQGYELRDLFINRPDKDYVGLFGYVAAGGRVENIGVVNASVTGLACVGGLVGRNTGTVSNSYSTGSATGEECVGGLVGLNRLGTVSDSYSTSSVTGLQALGGLVGDNDHGGSVSNSYSTGGVSGVCKPWGNLGSDVGGLVGINSGAVSNSYSIGSVNAGGYVGGLVGVSYGTVSNSYSTGSVTGYLCVGGLVGDDRGTVSNSYYNYDGGLINGEKVITIGALSNEDFEQWLANDKFLDVNERLSQENGYYMINDVSDFKSLLAFGQDGTLKFRLTNDMDLVDEPNFYIPYFAGEFDGNGYKISNLSFNFAFVEHVGLFGYVASGGKVTQVGVANVNLTGYSWVGGLVGYNGGTVGNSYSTGSVTGTSDYSGGLVGESDGTVSNSYSRGSVTGSVYVGGLVGRSFGTVSSSYSTSGVTGSGPVGGLVGYNGGTVSDSYSTGSVTGTYEDGGLVGANSGTVSNSYSTGSVTGNSSVGGLVGFHSPPGTLSNSFWDTETSGTNISDGGTGKNTTEMQDIATFSGAAWNITTVALNATNPAYIWNIVNNLTYPFLSWQA